MMNIRVHACTLCSMGGGEGGIPACVHVDVHASVGWLWQRDIG